MLYMATFTINIPTMLAYIPAPWILLVIKKQHYVGWLWRLPHGSTDFPPSSDGYGKQQTCLTVGFAGQDLNLCVLFFELSAHFTGMLDSRRLVNLNHIEFPCSTGVP